MDGVVVRMSDGLKDCPFCGGGAVVSGDMSVHCAATCEACGATVDATRVTDAVSKWNHRAAQAPAPVLVKSDVDGWVRRLRKTEEAGQARHMSKADRLAIADFLAALEAPEAGVLAELVEAAKALRNAVCGPTGFAEAVRHNTGLALPWPSLDAAEERLAAALALIARNTTEG
jgi:Lar family restriction alleviation protein